MKGGKRPLGYTIVEVMIVLAVSGMMFVIAAIFISGKQAKTEFTAGSNEFNSQMQDLISQVNDGKYSDINFNCSYGPTINGGSNTQGTNSACVFVGKMIYFNEGSNPSAYYIFSLAGNRLTSSGAAAISLADVNPTPIAKSGADLTDSERVPQSLQVKWVKAVPASGGGPQTTYAIGFLQSTGTSGVNGGYASGGQTIGLVYSNGPIASNLGASASSSIIGSSIKAASSATICLSDGTRYAEIQLGTNGGSQLSANLQVVSC